MDGGGRGMYWSQHSGGVRQAFEGNSYQSMFETAWNNVGENDENTFHFRTAKGGSGFSISWWENEIEKKGIIGVISRWETFFEYDSPDRAAFEWGKAMYPISKREHAEYSALMYWREKDGKTVYGLTKAVRFTNNETAMRYSPGPNIGHRHLHRKIPDGGYLYSHIHTHVIREKANETFSWQDKQNLANGALKHHYLVSLSGLILYQHQTSDRAPIQIVY